MKTRSIGIDDSSVPGARSMYSSARRADSRAASLSRSAGSGTTPEIGPTMPGFVPHVTCGSTRATSTPTLRSKIAPSSVANPSQRADVSRSSSSSGPISRPAR